MKTVLFVVVKRLRAVQSIDYQETATSAVIGAEEHLDKVHDGSAIALSCKGAAGAETTDEHSGETLQRLIAQVCIIKELFLVFVSDTVSKTYAVVGERESCNDGIRLTLEAEKIGLAEQLALIDKTILGEELVKVSFATTERTALGEFLLRSTHKVAVRQQVFYGHRTVQVFKKSETTFAS